MAKTELPVQGVRVPSLVKKLDPACHNRVPSAATKDPACHNQDPAQPNNNTKKSGPCLSLIYIF